ncbi:MAG: sugar phosphate isomerase/epimerase [Clostridia bacterium]|nr:sugar phosphate isomerase/epimerase [Clostridia bacterium]
MNVGIAIVFDDKDLSKLKKKVDDSVGRGFHHCQLMCWDPTLFTDENAEVIRTYFAEKDMTITAFWCGWEGPAVWNFFDGPETLGLVPETYRYTRVRNLIDGADFAKKLGVTDVISHMGFLPENPNDPAFPATANALRHVAEHLKKNDQYLLFETGQETPTCMLRMFEKIGTDNLGVNLDPANLIMYGKSNPVDALDVFGKFVRGVHAKDGKYPSCGQYLGPEVKLGEGKVNFPALVKGLHELGYDGSFTIEREISGEQQTIDIMEAKEKLEAIFATL